MSRCTTVRGARRGRCRPLKPQYTSVYWGLGGRVNRKGMAREWRQPFPCHSLHEHKLCSLLHSLLHDSLHSLFHSLFHSLKSDSTRLMSGLAYPPLFLAYRSSIPRLSVCAASPLGFLISCISCIWRPPLSYRRRPFESPGRPKGSTGEVLNRA